MSDLCMHLCLCCGVTDIDGVYFVANMEIAEGSVSCNHLIEFVCVECIEVFDLW